MVIESTPEGSPPIPIDERTVRPVGVSRNQLSLISDYWRTILHTPADGVAITTTAMIPTYYIMVLKFLVLNDTCIRD